MAVSTTLYNGNDYQVSVKGDDAKVYWISARDYTTIPTTVTMTPLPEGVRVTSSAGASGATGATGPTTPPSGPSGQIGLINMVPVTNSTPNNGDFWFDGTNLKFQKGGTTHTITMA